MDLTDKSDGGRDNSVIITAHINQNELLFDSWAIYIALRCTVIILLYGCTIRPESQPLPCELWWL